ncbi:MAG: hypothetical protein ACYDAE_17050 [Steroidobacteraceae bacterium]
MANGPLFDLQAALPRLLPKAIAWADAQQGHALIHGQPLTARELLLASAVEVRQPERVRITVVPRLPLPTDPELQQAAVQTGLLGPGMIGLTLGFAIFVVEGHLTTRLLSHECRHVRQYEVAGSIGAFLPLYLQQIVTFGYANAPFEVEARKWERDHV